MNKKGFTLVELLGVLVILGIIIGIAVPNIISTLDRNKKETFLSNAKMFIAAARYEITSGNAPRPAANEATIIKMKCVNFDNFEKDPDGDLYDLERSFVVVSRKATSGNSELVYHVQLVTSAARNRGIILAEKDVVDGKGVNRDQRLGIVQRNVTPLSKSAVLTSLGRIEKSWSCN